MVSPQFKNLYSKLNTRQKEAVDEIEGPVMVIAGPGTGKTQILTLRIANILLKTQVNPENILALTFSEAASFEMRDRLSEIIGTPAFRAEISTFHSFSNSIIKNYPEEFPTLLSSELITEIEQVEIIEKLIGSLDLLLLKPFGEPLYFLKDILQSINDLKKEGIVPEKLKTAVLKQENAFTKIKDLYHEKGKYKGEMKGQHQTLKKDIEKTKEFLKVFENYQKSLSGQKKYDFNDMLLEVIKSLQSNKSLLLRIQEKYQYILIDEHQDTNAAQNRLIELVASFYEIPNLFVVGDASQAIYRFQGASLENFLYFKKIYPVAKLINLKINYRSHQTILDASGSLIEKNISANVLPAENLVSSPQKMPEKIKVAELSGYDLEYEYIASEIGKQIKKNDPSKIAVLARRNMDLAPLAQIFNRKGIKFVIRADQDILKDLEIEKILLIFEAIGKPFDEETLVKVLQINFLGIDSFDVYKIISYSRKQKISINEFIRKINDKNGNKLGLEKPNAIISFYRKYSSWISGSNNIPFDELFVDVVNGSGFKEYFLQSGQRYQILNKLTALFDEVKLYLSKNPKFNLTDFLHLLQTAEKHKVSWRTKYNLSTEEGTRLMTVHQSKGLEFESVYIINCFDERWGNSRKRGTKIKIPWEYLGQSIKADVSFEEIEDERRLFYVGMTRAKKSVLLTYSKYGIDGKAQLPSQFLQEISSKFLEKINISGFEKSFNNAQVFNQPEKKEISPKDKKYLQGLFLEKGLSATGLDNFIKCPWRYFFRNLVSLPERKDKNLIFGSAVHFALSAYIKYGKIKKRRYHFLIDKFREYLDGQPLSQEEETECLTKGEKALKHFYKEAIPAWPADLQSEMPIKGVKFAEGIILNGRLDMIEFLPGDGAVRVHDFKSGKPKNRSQIDGSKNTKDYNYLRQLIFYRILLDRYKEGLMKMKEGVIDFIEPDEKQRLRSETFSIGESEVRSLEQMIKSVGEQIINLSFWDQTCGEKDCEFCLLRKMVF
ncbi:ATP-dependent helicase [Candidatus Daviesbacteria bacterium]|nr:ATP-dependent helicase [Candidatus Daviesbacteria bacterium]